MSNENQQNVPLGLLRAFLTLLVVAHHAALAYHSYAPPPPASLTAEPRMWMAFPVVDAVRLPGIDLFVGFNDTFFMSLMFLLAGVFTWSSVQRKGTVAFARDRALRLGAPFVTSVLILAPLAYLPTWLTTPRTSPFLEQWLALGDWPAGPAWFLWVLLSFGMLAGALLRLAPKVGQVLERITTRVDGRPIVYFALLIAASSLAYLPLAATFDAFRWISAGPFFVQVSRVAHYFVYFLAGLGLGAAGTGRGLLAADGQLARRWLLWIGASVVSFAIAMIAFVVILSTLEKAGPGFALGTFGNFTFVLSCAASSMAALATFLRFAKRSGRTTRSLMANAYGIFLLHYAFVSWLQFAMTEVRIAAGWKLLIVFTGAVLGSWIVSAGIRRLMRSAAPAFVRAAGAGRFVV